jgi:aspartate racemase
MKTIGLLGGMSWESTVPYYQIINAAIAKELGGLHSAKILLYSVDFHEIEACQASGDWQRSADLLQIGIQALEKGGADFIVICTNTMHKIIPLLHPFPTLPILHIAETTARALQQASIDKILLLGTRYTMEQDFYKAKLRQAGIDVLIPDEANRSFINDVIYDELCRGTINPASRQRFLAIIQKSILDGAQGVVLGCTEIGLLIKQKDTSLPVFDTTMIHAKAAALASLA